MAQYGLGAGTTVLRYCMVLHTTQCTVLYYTVLYLVLVLPYLRYSPSHPCTQGMAHGQYYPIYGYIGLYIRTMSVHMAQYRPILGIPCPYLPTWVAHATVNTST